MKQITLVIPSVRPEQLYSMTLKSLESTIIPDGAGFDVVVVPDQDSATDGWNKGHHESPFSDAYVLGADDLEFVDPNWLVEVYNAFQRMGWYGVVALNDGYDNYTHMAVSRKFIQYEMSGQWIPDIYSSQYMDTECLERASRAKCLTLVNAVVKHHHPVMTGEPPDEHYKYQGAMDGDRRIYEIRRASGYPNNNPPTLTSVDNCYGIAIGVRMMRPRIGFVKSLRDLSVPDQHTFIYADNKPSHIAANEIVRNFLKYTNHSHLLFIDDDMTFSKDALSLALQANVEVVMGFATHKSAQSPHAIVLRNIPDDEPLPAHLVGVNYGALRDVPDDELIEVDAVGLGFTLIRRDVLEDMISTHGIEYTDWFSFGYGSIGEDINFSKSAKSLGYRLYVTTKVKLGHVGEFAIGWNEHQRFIGDLK